MGYPDDDPRWHAKTASSDERLTLVLEHQHQPDHYAATVRKTGMATSIVAHWSRRATKVNAQAFCPAGTLPAAIPTFPPFFASALLSALGCWRFASVQLMLVGALFIPLRCGFCAARYGSPSDRHRRKEISSVSWRRAVCNVMAFWREPRSCVPLALFCLGWVALLCAVVICYVQRYLQLTAV